MSAPQYFGRYQVLSELGRGAMGVVYRGWDPQLERPVAIKVINAESISGGVAEEIVARFLREAKLAARVMHPGVVVIHDAGEQGGQLFLVMELVEGESLAARLRRGQYPTAEEAMELTAQVAEALGAAHQAGIVHRDVKPANVLITKDGRVKVSDFGVAKAVGEGTGLTRTGTTVGSPAYMSPEQVKGELVDARSDLFSVGVMLYEMLLRKRPFPAETLTTLVYQILNVDPFADPQALAGLREEVVAFLKWCLAKDPGQRIPDAATFARKVRALAKKQLTQTVSTTPTVAIDAKAQQALSLETGGGKRKRRSVPLVAVVAVLAFLGVLGVFLLRKPSPLPSAVLVGQATPTPGLVAEDALLGESSALIPSPTAIPTPTASPTPTPQPTTAALAAPPVILVPTPTPTPTPPPVVATYFGREGAVFNVSPEEALVEIEGKIIGTADDWDGKGGGKVYRFSKPGTYYARLSLQGYRTVWVAIVITPSADDKEADVDWEMEEL